ncbi:MAG TPA: adenylate cyclase [Ruminiclostridium sp.]|jgi:CYTH domain-containing protein|nr:CYTH domain-containing protein [Clostridiaceae bacterium]HAA24558.1 adenylate cyclase [Ruminiclostridium sp.]
MAKEIERRFLVKNMSFKEKSTGVLYRQGYLSTDPKTAIRVRTIGNRAFLSIKSVYDGISRLEYEYEIPYEDANEILHLCKKPIIRKYRYTIDYKGYTWEIDEFLDDNEGLVIAEIELQNEEEQFPKPGFIGEEITHDYRYLNVNLVNRPYKTW